MSEAAPSTQPREIEVLSTEHRSDFSTRRGREAEDFGFFDVGGILKPPDRDAGDGSQKDAKPGEGDDDPKNSSGEGGGKPENKEPSGAEKEITPEVFTARINRLNKRAERQLAAKDAEIANLQAQLAQRGDGGKPPDDGNKETKPGGDASDTDTAQVVRDGLRIVTHEAVYEALGVGGTGPDPGDYPTEKEWSEDFDLWADDKPLKNHPKLADAQAKAKTAAAAKKPDGGEGGDGGKKPAGDADAEAARERQALLFSTLEAAFDENEDADPDTELGTDVYDAFIDHLKAKRIRIQPAAFEHIVASDDGPEMVKMLVDSPAKANRLFLKAAGVQTEELAKMLERTRKRAEKEADPDGGGKKEAKGDPQNPGGKVMPEAKGGGNRNEEVDPSKMSQAEYMAYRRQQEAERDGGGFFF